MAGWSYRCGRKGTSAVRVYERATGSSLYIEWYVGGERVQRSLRSVVNHAVTDKRLAMRIAREVSRGLEANENRRAEHTMFGGSLRTLDELVDAYHKSARAREWSEHHRKAMERFRDFWLDRFRGMNLTDITDAMAENAAAELDVKPETRRKYLVYLTGAFNYAVRKLKWLDPKDDLRHVTLPKSDSRGVSYTLDEVRKLLPALEGVGLVPGWIGHVAFQCGRRLSAIRAVRASDITVHDDYSVIVFRKDKAGKVSEGCVTGRAHELTAQMSPDDFKPSEAACRYWLEKAEEAAGINHVTGRGWHGLKRAFATVSAGEAAASKQSGTRRETLAGIYEQDWLDPKLELARKIEGTLTDE